eukprot:2296027-Pleurochrysis_carterae.AAC.2
MHVCVTCALLFSGEATDALPAAALGATARRRGRRPRQRDQRDAARAARAGTRSAAETQPLCSFRLQLLEAASAPYFSFPFCLPQSTVACSSHPRPLNALGSLTCLLSEAQLKFNLQLRSATAFQHRLRVLGLRRIRQSTRLPNPSTRWSGTPRAE